MPLLETLWYVIFEAIQSKILSPMQNCFEIPFRFKIEYVFRICIFEVWIEKSIREKHLVKWVAWKLKFYSKNSLTPLWMFLVKRKLRKNKQTPCWSVLLISEKINLEKSIRRTGFLVHFEQDFYCLCCLQKSILKLIFAG